MNSVTFVPSRTDGNTSVHPAIIALGAWNSPILDSEASDDPTTTNPFSFARRPASEAIEVIREGPRTASYNEGALVICRLKYERTGVRAAGLQSASDAVHLQSPVSDTIGQSEENPEALNEALTDLRAVAEEALEEGFPQPSKAAIEEADRLVRVVFGLYGRRLEVYPTADGEVAIDALGERSGSVVLLCDTAGGALCLVNTGKASHRARYLATDQLPDWFLREALAELARRDQEAP